MRIRVTFDLNKSETHRLKTLIQKDKGISFDDYREVISEIVKERLGKDQSKSH